MSSRIGVLFVCLGNICRSPLAEGVFRRLVEDAGVADRFDIDSAGTSSYHRGEPPDRRTAALARQRGVVLEHAARQVTDEDLLRFDYLLAMDASNLGKLQRLAQGQAVRARLELLRSFDPASHDDLEVPDPYFGGEDGFEHVHDLVEAACAGLLEHIRTEHGL
jgi:protein-tyrosine phosphatase